MCRAELKQGQLKLAAAKVAAKATLPLLPEDPQPKLAKHQADKQSKKNENDPEVVVVSCMRYHFRLKLQCLPFYGLFLSCMYF